MNLATMKSKLSPARVKVLKMEKLVVTCFLIMMQLLVEELWQLWHKDEVLQLDHTILHSPVITKGYAWPLNGNAWSPNPLVVCTI